MAGETYEPATSATPSSLPAGIPANVRKTFYIKGKLGKYPLPLDSPAYDASEEDNDATDDGSAVSVPRPHQHAMQKGASSRKAVGAGRTALAAALAASDTDTGVDSPTYDGDVESSVTVTSQAPVAGSGDNDGGSTTTSPGSTRSSLPSSAFHGDHSILGHGSDSQVTPPKLSAPLPAPTLVQTEPTPTAEMAAIFDASSLTPQDIQNFVMNAIQTSRRMGTAVTIREPPTDRPIRVYADGVYDLFTLGQSRTFIRASSAFRGSDFLRQAKLSFPSVTLLVGVCSDELCKEHKSRTIMNHTERCESVRHCRWVNHVVADAPWVIKQDFLDKYAIDYVAHDDDPYAASGHEDVYAYVKSQGRFIPTRRTPGVSTSELLERIVSGYRRKEFDQKLEKMGRPSLKAAGSDFEDNNSP
ncbi:hypothetical protein BKA62DRAFT_800586 [Auriculariales sp. MPI-PUGE-AT-0066]|nr:hypothetical protein BKA62DRAFT_800586 [Auriculariales sp. MPI-PUGE-AT-0066]